MLLVTVRFSTPLRLVMIALTVLIDPAVTFPDTVIACKLPKAVMLLSVPCDKVPLNTPPVIVPGTVKLPIKPFTTLIDAAVTLSVTVRFVSVPIVVMLGWFAVVNVPLIVFVLILFVTVRFCKPLRLLMLALVAVNRSVVN